MPIIDYDRLTFQKRNRILPAPLGILRRKIGQSLVPESRSSD
jgi:hypothetical protein